MKIDPKIPFFARAKTRNYAHYNMIVGQVFGFDLVNSIWRKSFAEIAGILNYVSVTNIQIVLKNTYEDRR